METSQYEALKVMSVYAVYSLAVTLAVGRRLVDPARIVLATRA
jgi:hypothetical protein